MSSERPSERVIEQRVRNRIIEHLELASSFEVQQAYQAEVPFVNVPYEVINGWEDWVRPGSWPLSGPSGALTDDEVDAVRTFTNVWDAVADEIPDDYPRLAEVQAMEAWNRLRDAAVVALAVFASRGPLSEDEEVPN